MAVAAAAMVLGAASAGAAVLTVTTTADGLTSGDGLCSLREAIAAAASPGVASDCGTAGAGSNTIALGPHPYQLQIARTGPDDNSTGDLNVSAAAGTLLITGASEGTTTIDASGLGDRVLSIAAGASVTLRDLTVRGGHAPGGAPVGNATMGNGPPGNPGANGGGILNQGSLTVIDAAVSANEAGAGGAGGGGGQTNSFPAPDGAGGKGGSGGAGGGIYNTGTLMLNGATITGNLAGDGGNGGTGDGTGGEPGGGGGNGNGSGDGGGVANVGGVVTVTASTIASNHAGDGGSGGVGGLGSDGFNSGFTAGIGGTGAGGSSGGGISSIGGSLTVTNSTVVSNGAGVGGDGGAGGTVTAGPGGTGGGAGNGSGGGGVRVTSGSATLSESTIAANQSGGPGAPGAGGASSGTGAGSGPGPVGAPGAAAIGGGVYGVGSPSVHLQETLLATNAPSNCGGASPTDAGHNLSFGDASCPATFLAGDPVLGQLAANGGSTETIALGDGSAAHDQVPDCSGVDQRGVARPSGAACDIGAFQLAPPSVLTGSATAITASGARLNGIANPNQASASAHFEFGTTTAYGSTSASVNVIGIAGSPVAVTVAGLVPNTSYHYRLVATSSDGSSDGTDRTFRTAAVKPRVRGLSLKPSSFHAGHSKHAGTTITYNSNEPSTAMVTIMRCGSRPTHKHGKRCKTIGSFSHAGRVGHNAVRFAGLLNGRKLRHGRYRLQLTARAGGQRGNAIGARFTVLG